MKARSNGMTGVRAAVVALFASLLMALALAPGANAAKVDNPSPPNFRAEVTGGFLQFIGSAGTPLQLPLDFSTLDPPLPNPTLTGTVTTNGQRNGVINIPQAGISFPPIPVAVDDIALTIRLLPVGAATGFIDPLSGRVDLGVPIRLKAEGSALGQSLGDNCYVGSAGNPINLGTTTHNGTFPSTSGGVYVADFTSDGADFAGGWLAAEPYSDEAGNWALEPKAVPGKPVGGANGKPLPSEIPYNELTDFIPRATGSWRGMNETLAAPAAAGCGTGLAAGIVNDQVNSLIGLPSAVGASTASLDFKFNIFNDRPTIDNAIVKKAVKSNFVAPGLSGSPWVNTQVPTAVSAQTINLDASTSYFKVGGNATERYAFDFGTGTFGAWTTNPVTSFSAPTLAEGADPVTLPVRVKVKDTEGDEDITTRRIRVVPATDITLDASYSSVAGAKFRGGSEGHVMFDVTNASDNDSSSQVITFGADLPSGVTLTNLDSPAAWTCNTTASSVDCTIPQAGLAANEVDEFDLTVDVDTGAANPSNVTASAVMNGDPSPANNVVNDNVEVVKTDLALELTRTDDLAANGWTPYEIDIENVGDGLTVGDTTVDVALPVDFSYRSQGSGGAGWSCSTPVDNRNITCVRTASIAGNESAPLLTVVAKIDRTAAAIPATVSASVATADDVNTFNGPNSDDDTATVNIVPDLTVDTNINGDFVVGDPGEVTFSAINGSVVSINGPTTITSTLPAGLTVTAVSGSGWDCAATVLDSSDISCELAAGINGGENGPLLTATVAVAQEAYPGVTVSSTVANTEDGFAGNDSESADVAVRRLDVAIQKLAVKPFNVGIEGRYRLNVTNTGDAATVGAITVLDDLPAGLTLRGASGAGWDCGDSVVGGQHVECVLNSFLGAGVQASPVEIRVDVLDAAAEAGTVTNTAYVDTARDTRGVPADDAVTANNTSTVDTTAVAVDLSIDSTHAGDFRVMTQDVYSLTVRNVGFFGTDPGEPVIVTSDLPDGMLPIIDEIEITRPGWVCELDGSDVECVLEAPDEFSSAMEPESAVTIDIPVAITDAAADQSNNVAEVSTARDSNPILSPNNRSVDPTTVTRIDLEIDSEVTIPPRAGGIGEVSVDVDNIGSAATVAPSIVTIPLATGTSYRATGSTVTGWQCASPGAGTQVTCERSPIVASGGSTPPLKVRTNVGPTAPDSWSNDILVATTGEAPERLANNEVLTEYSLEKIDLAVAKSHDPALVKAGKRSSFKIEVTNAGNTASTGTIRVEDSVDSTFQNVSATGPGWSCSVAGNDVACTRTASLPAGATTPAITVGFDVPVDAAGTRDSTATVSNPSDPYPSNDSDNDPIQIVASADVSIEIDQPSTMKVGDSTNVTYTVENNGTESTSGSPSVKLRISASEGLDPVGTSSTDSWDCSAVAASGPDVAYFDCVLAEELEPGQSTALVADFDVIPTSETGTATLALVDTVGDVNSSNDFAFASSSLSGADLEASVAVPSGETAHLEAGVSATRQVNITNVGTSATTSPISVKVPLPEGVQWDDAGPFGTGWNCSQLVRDVNCTRANSPLAANASLPGLNIDLRPGRSNAPEVAVNYTVQTDGDENVSNNTATRTEEVRFKPETTITQAPPASTESRSATIAFTSDDEAATFECRVDAGVFEACTSPLQLTGLSIGQHTVTVRAINGNAMADDTPAAASWSITSTPPVGPSKGIKGTLTGGELSLASLGAVELPAEQISLDGRLYDNGAFVVPKEGVNFETVVQTIPDVLGPGSEVNVEISISATDSGVGTLPNGGGPATFTLPVRADVQAKLGSVSLIAPGTECALKPITFDLAGTYDEAGKSVSLTSPSVGFPQITGCDSFKTTIDDLLELPRNDIAIAMDFDLEEEIVACPDGQTGTPPDCVTPPTTKPILGKPALKAPKKVKSGKPVTITARVANTGDGAASNAKVCLTLKKAKKLAKGKAQRCKVIKTIAAGKTGVAKFKVKTKKIKAKKAKLNYSATVTYLSDGASKKHTKTGHVSLLK